jgi:hypothetical protein
MEVFMSQEPEDPGKWQIHHDYTRVHEHYITFLNQIREWGRAMSRVGNALSAHPEAVAQVDLTGIPNLDALERARSEIIGFESRLTSLKDRLTPEGGNQL